MNAFYFPSKCNCLLLITPYYYFFKKHFIYLLIETEREREAEIQAEGEVGSLQEPDMGLDLIPGLQDHAWAEGGAKPLSHHGCPYSFF